MTSALVAWQHQSSCWCASPVGLYFGRPCCTLHSSGRGCLITRHTSGLKRPSPQALSLFGGVGFIVWHLRRLSLREIPTVPEVFLKILGAWGLRLCARTHFKLAFCNTRMLRGAYVKYQCFGVLHRVMTKQHFVALKAIYILFYKPTLCKQNPNHFLKLIIIIIMSRRLRGYP